MPDRMLEDMRDRMSDDMPDRMLEDTQRMKICEKECSECCKMCQK